MPVQSHQRVRGSSGDIAQDDWTIEPMATSHKVMPLMAVQEAKTEKQDFWERERPERSLPRETEATGDLDRVSAAM